MAHNQYLPQNIVPCYYGSLIMRPGVNKEDFEMHAIWAVRDKALDDVMTPEEKDDEEKCGVAEFLHVMKRVFQKANEQDGGGDTFTSYPILGEVIKKCWIEWRAGGEEREERVVNVGADFVSNNRPEDVQHPHKD